MESLRLLGINFGVSLKEFGKMKSMKLTSWNSCGGVVKEQTQGDEKEKERKVLDHFLHWVLRYYDQEVGFQFGREEERERKV